MLLCGRLGYVHPLIFRIIMLVFICLPVGIENQHRISKVSFDLATFTAVSLLFRAVQSIFRSSPDLPSVDPAPPLALSQHPKLFFPRYPSFYPYQHSRSLFLSNFISVSHSPQSLLQVVPSAKHYSHSPHFLLSPSHFSPEEYLATPLLYPFPLSCFTFIIQFDNQQSGLIRGMDSNRKGKLRSNETLPQNYSSQCLAPFVRDALSPSHLQAKNRQIKNGGSDRNEERNEYQELKRHYECIERVLNEENLNLKMQAQYLASEMRKTLKREKSQRQELRTVIEQYQRAKQKLGQILQQNMQVKEYIQSKIALLINSLKLTTLATLQGEVKLIIKQFCDYFSISLDLKTSPIREVDHEAPIQAVQEENVEIGTRINDLNDKFEELMHEYKSTSHPEIRKQCIDIAKEIKILKTGRDSSLGNNKTVQMLNRQQSNDYFSIGSKYSKVAFDQGSQVREVGSEARPDKQLQRSSIEIQKRTLSRKSTMNRPSSFQNGQRL